MRLRLTSLLPCTVDRLVAELARPEQLNRLDAPVLTFHPLDPPAWPSTWTTGDYRVSLRVGGRLGIGEHTLAVRQAVGPGDPLPDGEVSIWHDAGFSPLIRRWDHQILVEPWHGMVRCTDLVEIDAGPLTLPAWLFAGLLYRHRQRRLSRLVGAGFDASSLA
jgi:hypothetical protein